MRKFKGSAPTGAWVPTLAFGLVATLGCGKPSPDTSPVLANAGGQKVTQRELEQAIHVVFPDAAKAEDILHNDRMRDQRNQILGTLSQQKAVLELARLEGLDQDPKVRLSVEGAIAEVYWKSILQKRNTTPAPADADLRKIYDDAIASQKAAGNLQPPPPFESVKPTLVQMWKQRQQQANQGRLEAELSKELETRVPITYAEDYQPKQQPAAN